MPAVGGGQWHGSRAHYTGYRLESSSLPTHHAPYTETQRCWTIGDTRSQGSDCRFSSAYQTNKCLQINLLFMRYVRFTLLYEKINRKLQLIYQVIIVWLCLIWCGGRAADQPLYRHGCITAAAPLHSSHRLAGLYTPVQRPGGGGGLD